MQAFAIGEVVEGKTYQLVVRGKSLNQAQERITLFAQRNGGDYAGLKFQQVQLTKICNNLRPPLRRSLVRRMSNSACFSTA